MDKEKFLESGLLQQYALGLTDEEESAKVEEHLRAYPEIREELQKMHDVLNSYADQLDLPEKKEEGHADPHPLKSEKKSDKSEKNQLVRLNRRTVSFFVLAFAGLLTTSIYFYAQNLILQHDLETHEAKIAQMGEMYDHQQTEQLPLLEELRFIEHEHTQKIMIDSTYSAIGRAVVYWNPLAEQAMIHLLDYHPHMNIGDLYLIDFAVGKSSLITKLEHHSNKLLPIPFFTHYRHLRIKDSLPNVYVANENQSILPQ